MPRKAVFVLVVSISIIAAACSGTINTANGNARGAQLYQANCAGCHGADAAGATVGGLKSADIRAGQLKSKYNNDPVLIKGAILWGRDASGNDLGAAMSHFNGKLSDADVNAIIGYLQSLP